MCRPVCSRLIASKTRRTIKICGREEDLSNKNVLSYFVRVCVLYLECVGLSLFLCRCVEEWRCINCA